MESVPVLSSQDGSGRVQLEGFGPTRNRKVVGSNPTSGSTSPHPWGRALSRAQEDPAPVWGLSGLRSHGGAVWGQGGAPGWANDLDLGEGRGRIMVRRPGRRRGVGLTRTHSGPRTGIRMTVASGPGCSVRSTAVLQAHAVLRARPVWPSPVVVAAAVWISLRMWKQRASSRRAIAVVAMLLPRRRASWA
jgi:hypothetical protein